MSIATRPLQADDYERWLLLWGEFLRYHRKDLAPEITQSSWERLTGAHPAYHGLVAVVDGVVVGFAHLIFHPSTWSIRNYGYLSDLYVAPEARGKGVGRALMEAIYAFADVADVGPVYWHTEDLNVEARRLYESVAYRNSFIQYRRRS